MTESATICSNLITESEQKGEDFSDWRRRINGQYYPGVNQETYQIFLDAPDGSAEWLYSRGVPSSLKGAFAQAAQDDNLQSTELENIAYEIVSSLIGEYRWVGVSKHHGIRGTN